MTTSSQHSSRIAQSRSVLGQTAFVLHATSSSRSKSTSARLASTNMSWSSSRHQSASQPNRPTEHRCPSKQKVTRTTRHRHTRAGIRTTGLQASRKWPHTRATRATRASRRCREAARAEGQAGMQDSGSRKEKGRRCGCRSLSRSWPAWTSTWSATNRWPSSPVRGSHHGQSMTTRLASVKATQQAPMGDIRSERPLHSNSEVAKLKPLNRTETG